VKSPRISTIKYATCGATSTDPQHVRLHPFRRPPGGPDPLPSRRCPRDGHSDVSHRHRLHLGCSTILPEEGLLWSPYDLLTAIQMHGGNGARAAVFFACERLGTIESDVATVCADYLALAFLVSQFGINIAGNAISGGIDLASLFPKCIDIRQGAIFTTVMALPMCPWALLSGATVYISVMSGYATFLGPMTGLMVFDYVLVRKQKMKLSALVSDCGEKGKDTEVVSTTDRPTRSIGTGAASIGARQ
jgi:hypothetical protein